MDRLKPCTFCGGEAETWSHYFEEEDMTLWQVRCKERPYSVEHPCYTADSFISFETEAEAVEAWNTRAERTCHDMLGGSYSSDMECSECRTRWYVGCMTNGEWNYCPNCGAKVV